MKPSVPEAACDLAARLRSDIVPELTGFRAGNVAMTAAMLDMIGEEWDRAAARLFEENAATRDLLTRGAKLTGDMPPTPSAMDLRISTLEAENAVLRTALIALQASLEKRDDEASAALDRDIWAELGRSVERRRISSANF